MSEVSRESVEKEVRHYYGNRGGFPTGRFRLSLYNALAHAAKDDFEKLRREFPLEAEAVGRIRWGDKRQLTQHNTTGKI